MLVCGNEIMFSGDIVVVVRVKVFVDELFVMIRVG